jgi:Peptidase M16 inactive domain
MPGEKLNSTVIFTVPDSMKKAVSAGSPCRKSFKDFANWTDFLATAANVPNLSELQDSVNLSVLTAISRFDPDYDPLQVANHVLGEDFYATRLYHDLRHVTSYVYDVDVRLNAQKTRAIYTVTYACDPMNVSKARELIQLNLISIQRENVTPAELQQAKALLLRQIPRARQRSKPGIPAYDCPQLDRHLS